MIILNGDAFTAGLLVHPFGLDTQDWNDRDQPWIRSRRPFGRITSANADPSACAITDVAIPWLIVRSLNPSPARPITSLNCWGWPLA